MDAVKQGRSFLTANSLDLLVCIYSALLLQGFFLSVTQSRITRALSSDQAGIAQQVEQRTRNAKVVGSIPIAGTI